MWRKLSCVDEEVAAGRCSRDRSRLDGLTRCGPRRRSGATPPTSINRTTSQIDSLQARAQTLAQRITNDQTKVSIAAEQYDEETILLQKDQATLAKTVKRS